MKRIILLAAAILVLGTAANASQANNLFRESTKTRFSFNDPIAFTERGIEFFVFPNGEFDFNTETTNSDVYYKEGRRNANRTYGAPGSNFNSGVRIEHDASGKVRRIGNVFVNYDAQDRIKRIGSVYMTYNRFALTQIGGLKITYSRNGQILNVWGKVKGNYENSNCQHDFGTNFEDDDSDADTHIYYKSGAAHTEKDKK